MNLNCLIKHKYRRHLEYTPLTQDENDPTLVKVKLADVKTCVRCGKVKRHEEIVPFQYVIEDE